MPRSEEFNGGESGEREPDETGRNQIPTGNVDPAETGERYQGEADFDSSGRVCTGDGTGPEGENVGPGSPGPGEPPIKRGEEGGPQPHPESEGPTNRNDTLRPMGPITMDRKAALDVFESAPMPTWRRSGFWTTSVKDLDFDALRPTAHAVVASRSELPQVVQDALGDEQYAGLIVMRGSNVVYTEVDAEAQADGVIASTLEEAFSQHGAVVNKYYGTRIGHDEGKFAAANAAFWTGGAFFYVPPDVSVAKPLQVVHVIDEGGTAQYGRVLAIVDRGSKATIREYNLAAEFEGQALHAGAVEIFVEESAWAKVKSFQDWGSAEIYDISTKRVVIGRDAHARWFPVHLGGHLTKQTLDIVTAAEGADMRHNGLYFTQGEEHLDLFTTDRHEVGDTTGDTVWKGAAVGRSRASYEGLIEIIEGAQGTNTYLQTHSIMLSKTAKVDAIPSLIVKTDDVSASHGGTVGEIDESLVFYMRTRGFSREQAIRVLVEGFFDPVINEFEDERLEELVRDKIQAKLAAAQDEIVAYAASK